MGLVCLGMMISFIAALVCVKSSTVERDKGTVGYLIFSSVMGAVIGGFLALFLSLVLSIVNIGVEKDYSRRVDVLSSVVFFDDEYQISYGEDKSDTCELQSLACEDVEFVRSDTSEICVYAYKRFPLDLLYSFNSKLFAADTPKVVINLDSDSYDRLMENKGYCAVKCGDI